ncbi:hypothetical protein BDN72DRAFT_895098 [Pluteus cervinus]|uniref:Uncharacterized protein n=1 Tax=Pluteus cervinus TaxID=181527 RepID=A0ACD3B258_9AGAR|nr:hypothetical protein BDN72DRAFT_895098 [Pluteus cervinus]
MSNNLTDSNFSEAIVQWLKDNIYVGQAGSKTLPVVTLLKGVLSGDPRSGDTVIQVHSGLGVFEVETLYSTANNKLVDLAVYLVVPRFGRVALFTGQNVYLDDPKPIRVKIPDTTIEGTIKFFKSTPKQGDFSEVLINWDLTTPFTGRMVEDVGYSLFPVSTKSAFFADKLKRVRQSNDLRGNETQAETADYRLLSAFLEDFVEKNPVCEGPGLRVVIPAQYNANNSGQYSIDVYFLSIFELVGSILPGDLALSVVLYVSLPLIGRVQLTSLKGSLLDAGVTATIGVSGVAKGSATIYAKPVDGGNHALYADLYAEIIFVGTFSQNGIYLLTLPYVIH